MSWHGEMYAEEVARHYYERGSLVDDESGERTPVSACTRCYALVADADRTEHYEYHNPDAIPS